MSEIAQIIQRQIPIGSRVKFFLSTEKKEVSGVLTEIGISHLTLVTVSGSFTCFLNVVQGWELLSEKTLNGSSERIETAVAKTQTSLDTIKVGTTADIQKLSSDGASYEVEAHKKLVEIEAFFEGRIQSLQMEILAPELQDPTNELINGNLRHLTGKWDSIRQRYSHAVVYDRGRLPEIIADLKSLIQDAPTLLSLRRSLPYFQYKAGKTSDALNSLKELCILSNKANDWYTLSSLAFELGDDALICYALGHLFLSSPLERDLPDWYAYIHTLKNLESYPLLNQLYEQLDNKLREDEEQFFFEGCLYVLKKSANDHLALSLVKRWLHGTTVKQLLQETLKYPIGSMSNRYTQVSLEIAQLREKLLAAQKKIEAQPKPVAGLSLSNSSGSQSSIKATQGTSSYWRAKRLLDSGKNLEKAIPLLLEAIKIRNENTASAVKKLAALYLHLGRQKDIISLLTEYRNLIEDRFYNNMLMEAYWQSAQYPEAIQLLDRRLKTLSNATSSQKAYMYWQLATCHMKLEKYVEAEKWFKKAIEIKEDHITAKRNMAICMIMQGKDEEAKKLLHDLLPDVKATGLLNIISQRKAGEQMRNIDELTKAMSSDAAGEMSDFTGEMSDFTRFFLQFYPYKGVLVNKIEEQNFDYEDIEGIEKLANQAGPKRPQERGEYYLSAAKILFNNRGLSDPSSLYSYLCRGFTSLGDAAVVEQPMHLDTAKTWYCEALRVYGGDRERGSEEGAKFSLVRFLFASTDNRSSIPIGNVPEIHRALVQVLENKSYAGEKIFKAITYLITQSKYAATVLLPLVYEAKKLRKDALAYLKRNNAPLEFEITKQEFIEAWNQERKRLNEELRTIGARLDSIARVEPTTLSSIENCLMQLKEIETKFTFDLDQQRLKHLSEIFEDVYEFYKRTTFEERERYCTQIDARCQKFLEEIGKSPTIFSVEKMYPIAKAIREQVALRREVIRRDSLPLITFRIPKGMDSCIPIDQKIDVQIIIENKIGCSPADALELIVEKGNEKQSFYLEGGLHGGEHIIQIVSIPVRREENAFSLMVSAQYLTYAGELQRAEPTKLPIQLGSPEQFQPIDNPYIPYAGGNVVGDRSMLYGRDEDIARITEAIRQSRTQSKSVIIYGQKRAGKSSILHHLINDLSQEFLIANVGNIGSHLDQHSQVPLIYQILWQILEKTQTAVEEKIKKNGYSPLNIDFPDENAFYSHPTPLPFFKGIFERLKQRFSEVGEWQDTRIVVCIDEFSYIHSQIEKKRLSDDFMINWKALLQGNLFSAVLVGLDVMPKFIDRFPNEFGTIQEFRVTYLQPEDAVSLMDEPIRIGGRDGERRYKENAIEYILKLTAGSPYYIQFICDQLVKYMNKKRVNYITDADVERVKDELLRGINRLDMTKFDNLIHSGDDSEDAIPDKDVIAVLKAIAINSNGDSCHHDRIQCHTTAHIDDILDDLVTREVIIEEPKDHYKIQVGLFREKLLLG